jgi:hypothetical protein
MVSSNKLKLEKIGKVQTTSRSQELRFQAYTVGIGILKFYRKFLPNSKSGICLDTMIVRQASSEISSNAGMILFKRAEVNVKRESTKAINIK